MSRQVSNADAASERSSIAVMPNIATTAAAIAAPSANAAAAHASASTAPPAATHVPGATGAAAAAPAAAAGPAVAASAHIGTTSVDPPAGRGVPAAEPLPALGASDSMLRGKGDDAPGDATDRSRSICEENLPPILGTVSLPVTTTLRATKAQACSLTKPLLFWGCRWGPLSHAGDDCVWHGAPHSHGNADWLL